MRRQLNIHRLCIERSLVQKGHKVYRNPVQTSAIGRRKALAVLEAGLELVAACTCEFIGRPANANVDRNSVPSKILSLLPVKTDPQKRLAAEQALQAGENKLTGGDLEGAIEDLTHVIDLAPYQYKLAQQALLKRTEAYQRLGLRAQQGEDFRKQWLWGRGVRWPGWYILGYIFLRRAVISPEDDMAAQASQSKSGTIPLEWGLVIILAILYNYLLFTFGLEY